MGPHWNQGVVAGGGETAVAGEEEGKKKDASSLCKTEVLYHSMLYAPTGLFNASGGNTLYTPTGPFNTSGGKAFNVEIPSFNVERPSPRV